MGNAAVEALCAAGCEVTAVIADRIEGPGFPHYACQDLIDLCHRRGIRVWSGMDLGCREAQDRILDAQPDAFVIATSKKVVPLALVDCLGGRVINCHPSLLPRHRGPTPVPWTIECGDPIAGLTFIQPTPELDAGPIWYRCHTAIRSDETAGELRYRLEQSLLPAVLPGVVEGVVHGRLQPVPQSGTPTYERRFTECVGDVDWAVDSLDDCLRRFRARTPYPGAYIEHEGCRYRVTGLTPTEHHLQSVAGTVELITPDRCMIGVSDGVLTVKFEVESGETVLVASG